MKKIILLAVFFLLIICCRAQDNLLIQNLGEKGILLDKGWKYQPGDNPEWANANYDDKNWVSVNPVLDIVDSLPLIQKSGTGWFRIHLALDSNSLESQLSLVIQQSVAAEYYLNGKLIHKFGKISKIPGEIKAYDPLWKPVSFPVNKEPTQVLAIRFAIKPGVRYTGLFETYNPALHISIMKFETAVHYYTNLRVGTERFMLFIIGISVMLFILHISFFLVYPSRKPSLYIALFALIYLFGDIIQLNFFMLENDVSRKFLLGNISFVFFIAAEFSLLVAIYSLFQRKKDTLFWLTCIYIIPALLFNAFPYGWGWKVGGPLLEVLVHIGIVRVSILAAYNKKRSAYIIATGGIASLLFFILFLTQGTFYNNSFVQSLTLKRTIYYVFFQLSIPIATSIYLGLDFAFINRFLQQKLSEVESLSKKNMAQEQEKQQLLFRQNEMLEKKVSERTESLKQSLENLKATQTQLIQSEKMASLGELTAGIAHEIQNPLNFVNNFSEVNNELIGEMKQELQHGNNEGAISIANDIEQNLEKINHHGKRADAIVKGMLQHSQKSSGQKEPTDLNALCDEYLRLAFHGLRAKDKSFNSDFKTDLDESIGKINIVPQDIGRVLLNLYNNAFYTVNEKKKQKPDGYDPAISVSTKKTGDKVILTVKDNGNGIPQNIVDKIFQPFFTTKPTGQGTGLGLSLSYEIIKAHGGEIKVESREGEGSEFIVQIPGA